MDSYTRTEQYLDGISSGAEIPVPYTREEQFLAGIANGTDTPEPYTREEQFLKQIAGGLNTARTDIRSALEDKGVSASDHDFTDFAQDIEDIPTGGGSPFSGSINYIAPSRINLSFNGSVTEE
jgi:hypothetical protein